MTDFDDSPWKASEKWGWGGKKVGEVVGGEGRGNQKWYVKEKDCLKNNLSNVFNIKYCYILNTLY